MAEYAARIPTGSGRREPVRAPSAQSHAALDRRAAALPAAAYGALLNARPLGPRPVQRTAAAGPSPGQVAQRVLLYEGAEIRTRQELVNNEGAFDAYMAADSATRAQCLADPVRLYDLANDLTLVERAAEQVGQSERAQRNELGQGRTTEIVLEQRVEDYPQEATCYAPIEHALLVINDGPIRFVGTNGLLGCVEVMIEYRAEREIGYMVAHVSSEIADDEAEVGRQLQVMLDALSREIGQAISWAEFGGEDGRATLTLVRNNPDGHEENLFLNMRNILAESGAAMRIVNSPSVSLEITSEGALYYDNQEHEPEMDYRGRDAL